MMKITVIPMPLVLLIVAAAVLLAGAIIGIIFLVFFLLGNAGGWRRLAEAYPATNPPTGQLLHGQTIKIGAVIHKRCATVGIADEGLYLVIWRKKAIIPWSEIKSVGQETLYWQKMPRLAIGEPLVATVTLPPALFTELRGRLPANLTGG
jgi:hypothetical protein